MLTTLRIKNLALVADLTLELKPGYNAITGETGAGKSILIGALGLVLGERADRTWIRTGSESCTVEAVFVVPDLQGRLGPFLEQNGLEPGDAAALVLKRSVQANGANRQFVNGSPTTLAVLAALGRWLVDIHGPHDHQSLLDPAAQLDLLDGYAGARAPRARFSELVQRRQRLAAAKAALIVDERTYAQQLELARHQVREIEAAHVQPDEEEALQRDYQRAHNAACLLELAQAAQLQAGEDELSVARQAGALGRTLQELERLDAGSADLRSVHGEMIKCLHELQSGLSRYLDRLELDPDRLRQLTERLDLLQALKRKYGPTLAAVVQFGGQARQRLVELEQREVTLARLETDLAEVDAGLGHLGQELTAARRRAIPKLCGAVNRELTALGFRQGVFSVSLTAAGESVAGVPLPSSTGFDRVEFQFAPNPGESARPLRAIASSGEIARVMLAVKTVLAAQDEVPVLVFDEVDANVGGETAQVVGDKMRQLGRRRQVLCVTHLAPVAARATAHCLVSKEIRQTRSTTEVRWLSPSERVTELARMLGGQSETARQHASALLKCSGRGG
jgi:DNA repair protein RecN (Recombination protein N)